MIKWPRLRLTKYVDDLTISNSGRNCTVAATISEPVSLLVGWLESGPDFYVSKDKSRVEGKSVVLVSNHAFKTVRTAKMKALGMRVFSHTQILGVG